MHILHTMSLACAFWPEVCLNIGVFFENVSQSLVIMSKLGSNDHFGSRRNIQAPEMNLAEQHTFQWLLSDSPGCEPRYGFSPEHWGIRDGGQQAPKAAENEQQPPSRRRGCTKGPESMSNTGPGELLLREPLEQTPVASTAKPLSRSGPGSCSGKDQAGKGPTRDQRRHSGQEVQEAPPAADGSRPCT